MSHQYQRSLDSSRLARVRGSNRRHWYHHTGRLPFNQRGSRLKTTTLIEHRQPPVFSHHVPLAAPPSLWLVSFHTIAIFIGEAVHTGRASFHTTTRRCRNPTVRHIRLSKPFNQLIASHPPRLDGIGSFNHVSHQRRPHPIEHRQTLVFFAMLRSLTSKTPNITALFELESVFDAQDK